MRKSATTTMGAAPPVLWMTLQHRWRNWRRHASALNHASMGGWIGWPRCRAGSAQEDISTLCDDTFDHYDAMLAPTTRMASAS